MLGPFGVALSKRKKYLCLRKEKRKKERRNVCRAEKICEIPITFAQISTEIGTNIATR